jgi:mono/diheme cytochrome c family protein
VYGYTYETLRNTYGDTNLNALYQQAARLTQGSQQLAGQAHTEFSGLVQQAGDNQARVAEILARSAAAANALRATEPQAQTTTQTRTTVTGTASAQASVATPPDQGQPVDPGTGPETPNPNVPPQQTSSGLNPQQWLAQVGRPLCGGCHGAKDGKGGFAIDRYPSLSPEQRDRVIERLFTSNPDRRMPRDGAGKPARLSPQQVRAFLSL